MKIQSQLKVLQASLALSLSVSSVSYADTPTVNVKEQFNQPDLQTSLTTTPKHKRKVDVSSLQGKTGEMLRTTDHIDYWFYDAWVTLYGDRDYDGYFYGFSLEFDADTAYYQAPVYAIVYLGKNDFYEPFHVTSVFTLFGESSDDSVLLESELETGYPTGDYDILIELIDADLRPYSSFSFVGDLQDRLVRHPLMEAISFRGWRSGPGGDALDIQFYGADASTLKNAAEALKTELRGVRVLRSLVSFVLVPVLALTHSSALTRGLVPSWP